MSSLHENFGMSDWPGTKFLHGAAVIRIEEDTPLELNCRKAIDSRIARPGSPLKSTHAASQTDQVTFHAPMRSYPVVASS